MKLTETQLDRVYDVICRTKWFITEPISKAVQALRSALSDAEIKVRTLSVELADAKETVGVLQEVIENRLQEVRHLEDTVCKQEERIQEQEKKISVLETTKTDLVKGYNRVSSQLDRIDQICQE